MIGEETLTYKYTITSSTGIDAAIEIVCKYRPDFNAYFVHGYMNAHSEIYYYSRYIQADNALKAMNHPFGGEQCDKSFTEALEKLCAERGLKKVTKLPSPAGFEPNTLNTETS